MLQPFCLLRSGFYFVSEIISKTLSPECLVWGTGRGTLGALKVCIGLFGQVRLSQSEQLIMSQAAEPWGQ